MLNSQTMSTSCLPGGAVEFWQHWQQNQDHLYRNCIKWMGGNPIDAEDALSRAMLKAWEKVQQYRGKIANFKAWVTRLTHNLCVDIHRERSRGANLVEDIEGYGEELGWVQGEETPEIVMETGEKREVIRRGIDNLPPRLRETFILYFYQELSYSEIAQRQEISYQNVCKRISQARAILRQELRGYFSGEEERGAGGAGGAGEEEIRAEPIGIGTDRDLAVPPTATESAMGEMSQEDGEVEAIVGETEVLSVVVEATSQEIKLLEKSFPPLKWRETLLPASQDDFCGDWVVKTTGRRLRGVQATPMSCPSQQRDENRFSSRSPISFIPVTHSSPCQPSVAQLKEIGFQSPFWGWRWRVWMDSGGSWLFSI